MFGARSQSFSDRLDKVDNTLNKTDVVPSSTGARKNSFEEPKLISVQNSNLQLIQEETDTEAYSDSITPRLFLSRNPEVFDSVLGKVDFYEGRTNYIFLETYNELEERIKK